MSTIFSKIVAGEIPAYKIAENDDFLAFLDIMPLAIGHVLVIPKKEVDYIFDMEDDLYSGLFLFTKEVSKAISNSIACKKVGIAVIGLEVPHAHIHLVPLQHVSDINFERPKMKVEPAVLEETASKIRAAFGN